MQIPLEGCTIDNVSNGYGWYRIIGPNGVMLTAVRLNALESASLDMDLFTPPEPGEITHG